MTVVHPGEQWVLVFYPVRQAAYASLRRLGVETPKPEGYVDGNESGTVEHAIRSYLVDD